MILWLPLLCLLFAWGYVVALYDRLSRHPYQTRNAYRYLFLATFGYALFLTNTATRWWVELTHLIAGCR